MERGNFLLYCFLFPAAVLRHLHLRSVLGRLAFLLGVFRPSAAAVPQIAENVLKLDTAPILVEGFSDAALVVSIFFIEPLLL